MGLFLYYKKATVLLLHGMVHVLHVIILFYFFYIGSLFLSST